MKTLSYNEALYKLAALCSRAEQCIQSCQKKLTQWSISEEDSEKIISYLIQEKYLDERRYAHFFVKDKHQLAHWGKAKITQSLRMKKIPQALIDEALSEIKEENYEGQLKEVLIHKIKSVKAKNNYELKGKLYRFALGRGYEGEKALKAIDDIIKEYSTFNDKKDDNEDNELF